MKGKWSHYSWHEDISVHSAMKSSEIRIGERRRVEVVWSLLYIWGEYSRPAIGRESSQAWRSFTLWKTRVAVEREQHRSNEWVGQTPITTAHSPAVDYDTSPQPIPAHGHLHLHLLIFHVVRWVLSMTHIQRHTPDLHLDVRKSVHP